MWYATLLATTFVVLGCTSIQLPNVQVCAVSGVLSAGMDCAKTLSDETAQMTLDETIQFLEPTDTRGAAICQSAEDWNKLKTALEVACEKLGRACTREAKEQISQVSSRVSRLQERVRAKRPKGKAL